MRELNESDINMISAGLTPQTMLAGLFTIQIVWVMGVMFAAITTLYLLEEA